jgi:hypothetical protein
VTDKIIPFEPVRRKKEPEVPAKRRALTNAEIFADAYEDVIGEWEAASRKGLLNEYIQDNVPPPARAHHPISYVTDISTIAEVERRLEIKVAVFSPGTTFNNPNGWLVAFHHDKDIFSTPPDVVSEPLARALNVLLYLRYSSLLRRLRT